MVLRTYLCDASLSSAGGGGGGAGGFNISQKGSNNLFASLLYETSRCYKRIFVQAVVAYKADQQVTSTSDILDIG